MQLTRKLWTYSLTLILLLNSCSLKPAQILYPTPLSTLSAIDSVTGDLLSQVNYLESHMPREGSNGYIIPDVKDIAGFTQLVLSIENADLKHANELATSDHYWLVRYVDEGDNNAVDYLLQEKTPIGNGWGMYVLRETVINDLIIESPHPYADARTQQVALDIYRILNARALIIAGAHRDANIDGSADVAHVPGSIFQAIHETLSSEARSLSQIVIVLQIHGFTSSKHPNYPQVVIGYSLQESNSMTMMVNQIKDALIARDMRVGLCDGKLWRDLCGTKNIQSSTNNGVLFIHLELDQSVRTNDDDFIMAMKEAFASILK